MLRYHLKRNLNQASSCIRIHGYASFWHFQFILLEYHCSFTVYLLCDSVCWKYTKRSPRCVSRNMAAGGLVLPGPPLAIHGPGLCPAS